MFEKQHCDNFLALSCTCAIQFFELIYSNINSLIRTISHRGIKYFVTFINDFLRKFIVYFMKQNFEQLDAFKILKALVEKHRGLQILKLYSKNGGEYILKTFKQFYEQHSIQR